MLEWFNYPHASAHPDTKYCQSIPHRHFTRGLLKPPLQLRMLYRARKWTDLLPSFHSICCLYYVNFMLQAKNAANKATDGCGCRMSWHLKHIRTIAAMYICELSGPTFHSPRKNLAWWAVTQRISKNHKTVIIGGGAKGACAGMGTCPGQYDTSSDKTPLTCKFQGNSLYSDLCHTPLHDNIYALEEYTYN